MILLAASALASPLFDVERGLIDAAVTVTLTPGAGGTLLYSVDSSEPTLAYTTPLAIQTTTVVRAVEVAADGARSEIVTHTYLSVADVLVSSVMDPAIVNHATYGPIVASSLRELPTISLVVPGGMQMWEQGVSLEWIDPDGDDRGVNAGAYISGGTSWAYEKTSFRILFRSEYGLGKLDLDLYGEDATGLSPADEHDALSLRGGNHDTVFYLGAQGQHLRNFWMDESQLEMGHVAPHGRFAHLYVNGVYNGLYNVRERMNAAMLAEYLGGDEDDYEAVNGGTAFDGSGAAWAAAVASATDFETFREWVNVPDFLDYMILNFYAGNAWDWSADHNWIAVGPTEPGGAGFRFHSSDSDICLYYDYTVNILDNGGPSYVFYYLRSENHPDFQVALMDAIHRNLEGPLSAEAAGARYERLAALAENGVVAESARWGFGWWDRDGEWMVERDRLLTQYFPYRTDELYRQVRAAGWYPVDPPTFDLAPGLVAEGTPLTISAPDGSSAELWVSLDGQDPRLPGGETSAAALGPDAVRSVALDASIYVMARLRAGDAWGPLEQGFYEVDAAPPFVLNEWNAVETGKWLGGDDGAAEEGAAEEGADAALGRTTGNGGDWIELLVVEDGLDLRGWTLTLQDRSGEAGTLVFTGDPALSALRAGTILTIAEDLPEDPAYDPRGGDWRFHLRAGVEGSGAYVSATPFDVTHQDWQLTAWDALGHVRLGPVGEGVGRAGGVGSTEVGFLAETPTAGLRRDTADYADATSSTFGAPNVWADGEQDLDTLRGIHGGVADVDETGETAAALDTGDAADTPDRPVSEEFGACGCRAAGPLDLSWTSLVLIGLAIRRRGLPAARPEGAS
ncbi:MAG: CotH kinase family protein [Pseudomonadota bacterium]|nr:CotH kinase family protein [Pseudomonadota bacterium]